MHFLWVALLVSVVTTLLPKGLHAVQQQSDSSKALPQLDGIPLFGRNVVAFD